MHTTDEFEAFNTKFRIKELLVESNASWTWSVRPDQPTLGSSILSLNRPALKLSEVTTGEMADFANLVAILENTLKNSFDYNIMNYLMLMMVDHHVHYHVLPRYDRTIKFNGLSWVDEGWPALPVIPDSQHKDTDALEKIKLQLKKAL